MDGNRLYLLDATAFCYRAFYAVKGLSTSYGEPTAAVYGFVNILNKILKENKPKYLAACFDVSRDTFRSRKFAQYKLQRPAMPDELSGQIPLIKEVISAYGIKILEEKGLEADDIIAALTRQAKDAGMPVTIVSSDKDILQLVEEGVEVFSPYKDGGVIYDEKEVARKFGVSPAQVADFISLTGDSADNIPGIPGIGEKTALSLIQEFGSLDNLLKNVAKVSKEKIRESLKLHAQQARLNKELVVLDGKCGLEAELDELKLGSPDAAKLAELFKRLEFKKFLSGLNFKGEAKITPGAESISDTDAARLLENTDELIFSLGEDNEFLFYHAGKALRVDSPGVRLKKILSDPAVKKIGHDLKLAKVSLSGRGIALEGFYFDTMIAAYLLNPSQPGYGLSEVALHYLDQVPGSGLSAEESVLLVKELKLRLEKELKGKELIALFRDTELPLAGVLAQMELCGITLDLKLLSSLSKDLEKKLNALIKGIYGLSGTEFNINSPKQLRTVLFDNLKLPVIKRTKTGPSTDEEVLNKLARKHKLPELLLEYRQLTKLKTTYVDALPKLIDPADGQLHTSFNQCATETGRLSSSNPNLQNIPVKTDIGRQIRRAVIASGRGRLLLACDYSQIELRVLAHLSQDENLIAAFKAGSDIHKATAALIFSADEKDVTDEMRDNAKRVNFGIVYGLTSFGLSRDLDIPIDEAQAFIDAYFARYPKVREYSQEQIEKAQSEGFVTTILGRRRYLPEINSRNISVRQFAQRQAINTPIQGSASDLIKLAMIGVQSAIREKGLSARMILQIHDELLFDLPSQELAPLASLVKDKMENVLKLDVPVKVDIKEGNNWLEMSSYEIGRGVE